MYVWNICYLEQWTKYFHYFRIIRFSISKINLPITNRKHFDFILLNYFFRQFANGSPGLVFVSQPLASDNYASWSHAMVIALSMKNKLSFIDGTISWPQSSEDLLNHWVRNNNIVISWILNSISKEISASIIYSESAHDIWTDLNERYQQRNGLAFFS